MCSHSSSDTGQFLARSEDTASCFTMRGQSGVVGPKARARLTDAGIWVVSLGGRELKIQGLRPCRGYVDEHVCGVPVAPGKSEDTHGSHKTSTGGSGGGYLDGAKSSFTTGAFTICRSCRALWRWQKVSWLRRATTGRTRASTGTRGNMHVPAWPAKYRQHKEVGTSYKHPAQPQTAPPSSSGSSATPIFEGNRLVRRATCS